MSEGRSASDLAAHFELVNTSADVQRVTTQRSLMDLNLNLKAVADG